MYAELKGHTMNQSEQIISRELDGNFWHLCPNTNAVIHKRVSKDYLPSYGGFDFSAAGKRARRDNTFTHRNPKRNLEGSEFEKVRSLIAIYPNMDDIYLAMRKQGSKASARAVHEAVRRIRASNG